MQREAFFLFVFPLQTHVTSCGRALTMFTIRVVFVLRKSCAAPTLLSTSPTVSWRSQREAAIRKRDESDRVLSLLGVWTHVHLLHGGLQACDDGAGVFLKMTSADVCLRTAAVAVRRRRLRKQRLRTSCGLMVDSIPAWISLRSRASLRSSSLTIVFA